MDKKLGIWLESIDSDGLYINIRVSRNYIYDITVSKIGNENDMHAGHGASMWAWINHMRHKNWWNGQMERDLIGIVEKNIHRYKK